ncbi:MAG: hypothetical protein AAB426_11755 [Myxococcota bacterium]
MHRYAAEVHPAGAFLVGASAQQAIVPAIGVGESISGRLELFGPYGFSIGSDGFGSSKLYTGFVRWRAALGPYASVSFEAAYERLVQTFEYWTYDDVAEEDKLLVWQRLDVALVDVGATVTVRPLRWAWVNVGYGWQGGQQRGRRECHEVEPFTTLPRKVITCDDHQVLPDARQSRPRFQTVSTAVQLGWPDVGAFVSSAWNLVLPVGDVPKMWPEHVMLGFGFYARLR